MISTLTGRKRYRVQTRWFKEPLLVLQVEEHVSWYEVYGNFNSMSSLPEECIKWRDATMEDISTGDF